MKKIIFYTIVFFIFGAACVFGIGEKLFTFGALTGWQNMETRRGISELADIRPGSVLALSSANIPANYLDLSLSFDEGSPARFRDQAGMYDLIVSPSISAAGPNLARKGDGACGFTASQVTLANAAAATSGIDAPLRVTPRQGALFAPGSHIRDFSIEFWLYPSNPGNGEQIINWSSVSSLIENGYQRIQCVITRNRLQWNFTGFFVEPDGKIPSIARNISMTGSPILPNTWSHHLLRYNSDYGLLEYLVDGRQEAIVYVTSTGREGGEIYAPIIGNDSGFIIGSRFTGLIDEFRIYSQYLNNPVTTRYQLNGGRAESRTIDLGRENTRLIKLEAKGGRIIGSGNPRAEYAGSSNLDFIDYSEIRFYIRYSNNPYQWPVSWIPVKPGVELPQNYFGRYIQIAAEFFPSGDGETTPYLEEVRLVYKSIEPLPPPNYVAALARDGAVELTWRPVVDSSLGGYLVYYGVSGGEYFGVAAPAANSGSRAGFASPIDAGNMTSIRIEGLQNGTLYYFAVASYDKDFREPGDFSRETAARPRRDFLAQ